MESGKSSEGGVPPRLSSSGKDGAFDMDGAFDGSMDGTLDGSMDGAIDGSMDGAKEGRNDGTDDGSDDGAIDTEGDADGISTTSTVPELSVSTSTPMLSNSCVICSSSSPSLEVSSSCVLASSIVVVTCKFMLTHVFPLAHGAVCCPSWTELPTYTSCRVFEIRVAP